MIRLILTIVLSAIAFVSNGEIDCARFYHAAHRFGWDGDVILHEWDTDAADAPRLVADAEGRQSYDRDVRTENLVTWVYDGTSFTPVAKVTEDGRYTIVHDYLGTPMQAYDGNGELVWEMMLDVYGRVMDESHGDRALVPFRYQGQYEDAETGLYYNRFRYYSPEMGMYISSDPIGLAGNNPTLYGYVQDEYMARYFRSRNNSKQSRRIRKRNHSKKWLQNQFPNAEILSERYLKDVNGKSVYDVVTDSRRRVDFVVVEKGKVIGVYEVTSPTADKSLQSLKEGRIRQRGGTYIKEPGRKGKLYDISGVDTTRLDVDLKSKKVKCH